MSGQADTAPVSMDDVAAFLVDNPEADQQDDLPNDDLGPDDESDNPDGENPDGGNADGDSPDDDADGDPDKDTADASEKAKGQPSGLKFKVPVKGEDGSDTTIEVDEKELIAGYQRHADYTRKTQELGNREREAHELVSRKLIEGRDHYMRETQKAHAAIQMLAGLKTDAEMAQLAATDQNAWVQEKARAEAIRGVLAQLDQSMALEQQQVQQQTLAAQQKEFHHAWGVLGQEGIDKPKLQAIFQGIAKTYGVDEQRFATVTDPKVVLIMRDAIAFRQLKAQAATTKQKVQAAPKLPAARQAVPRSEQVNKRLDQRFRSGKAGTRDLAAFISNNSK